MIRCVLQCRITRLTGSNRMANRENRSVSFTPEQADFVESCVASGRYQSASEVVREGLRLLEHQEDIRQAEITARLQRGMANFEQGKHRPAKRALRDIADEIGVPLDR